MSFILDAIRFIDRVHSGVFDCANTFTNLDYIITKHIICIKNCNNPQLIQLFPNATTVMFGKDFSKNIRVNDIPNYIQKIYFHSNYDNKLIPGMLPLSLRLICYKNKVYIKGKPNVDLIPNDICVNNIIFCDIFDNIMC